MSAASLDIKAFKRVPWSGTFVFVGPDYSAAAFLMHIRQHWGDTGTPLLQPTITAEFDPSFEYYDARKRRTFTAPATIVTATIAETALEALPYAAQREAPLELVYDLHITPTGALKHVAIKGRYDIYPGSTI